MSTPPFDQQTEESLDPQTKGPFDPKTKTAAQVHTTVIENFADRLTDDEQYRVLFKELFKHVILLPPLLLMSMALHFVSAYLGPPQNRLASLEHFFLQCMSLALVCFAFMTVVLTLLDALMHMGQSSEVFKSLCEHIPRWCKSLREQSSKVFQALREYIHRGVGRLLRRRSENPPGSPPQGSPPQSRCQ